MSKITYVQPGTRPMSPESLGKKKGGGGMDDDVKKIFIVGAIMVALVIAGLYGCAAQKKAKAEEAQPTEAPTSLPTLTPTVEGVEFIPQEPLSPEQVAATATFQAAISRPAAMNAPGAYPFFIGVITYESGCPVSNLGFTTAGLEGQPYYLYFQIPLDRDPLMQMVQVQGYTQKFDGCEYPVIMVQQLFWLNNGLATPAPLAMVMTDTITSTAPISWGLGAYGLPTPDKHQQPVYDPLSWTPTPYPTYTPFPTATPYVPPARVDPTARPTYTPYPTQTPYPTPTPNPATAMPTPTSTPQQATVYGRVVSVAGCPQSNFAIQAAPNQNYFLIFDGAQLPPGNPTSYFALTTGKIDIACSGQAIKANSITWYEPATATPTSTPTLTPTLPTVTETATVEPTATETPTVEPTATEMPTVEPTATMPVEPPTEPPVEP